MGVKQVLIDQINSSPEPLKSYIHDLESTTGNVALMTEEVTGNDILQLEVLLANSTNHDVEFYVVLNLMPIKGSGVL